MDLQKYFARLEKELISGGMSEAQSKAYCKRLSASLVPLDDKARQEKLASYGEPEDLAKRVMVIAGKSQAAAAKDTESQEASEEQSPGMEHTVNAGGAIPVAKRDDVTRPIPTVKDAPAEAPVAANDMLQATRQKPLAMKVQTEEEKTEKKPLSKRGMWVFFGTAALTSPITLSVVGGVLGLFALLQLALVVIAAAMFVAVTVTVICGILLALVCLGYGIVKMLPGTDAFFIGLYEFGLGMILVGGTIVFPILEYNCATALVPFCMKKLTKILKFLIRQTKRLVVYLYGLCRDL